MTKQKATRKFGNSHYDWLHENLVTFLTALNLPDAKYMDGLISAHGDKWYCEKQSWEKQGIPFEHGVAIALLSYVSPYNKESRETKDNGWVHPARWVEENYQRFLPFLPAAYGEK
jgi:hypothetical protein